MRRVMMRSVRWSWLWVVGVVLCSVASTAASGQIVVAQDGSGDHRTIQAGIDAAEVGDTVYVKAGTYEERITFKSGITLRGEGREVTTITYSGELRPVTITNASSGTITGFTIHYGGTGDRATVRVVASRVSIIDCIVTGAVYSGIEVRDAGSDVVITDNVIRDNTQAGVIIYEGAGGTVRRNEIYGNGLHGIAVRDAGTDPLIEDNTVRDNTESGIFILEGAGGTVRRNVIYGNGLNGMGVRNAGTDALIEENTVRDNTQAGIFIYEGAGGTVRRNVIYGNGHNGITVRNAGTSAEILQNTIALNTQHGVWAYDEARATLTGNIIVLNGSRGVAGDRSGDPDGEVVLSHNNVWGNEAGDYRGTSAAPTDISADPQFVDAERRDFRLQPTSPCIGAAEEGRDMGAHSTHAPPRARFSFTPLRPTLQDTVRFTDTSTATDRRITAWRWEFGDGSTSTLRNPTHRYTRKGTFTVRLTVTDDDGATDTTTRTITVVNLPPVASFTVALHIEHLGLVLRRREVTFDASDSHDPDGEIVRYAWDLGDGNTAEGRVVTHTYPEAGTYTVRLTVTDDDGMTDMTEQEVQVVPGGGGGPG